MKKYIALIVCISLMALSCGKKEVKKETIEGRTASEAISVSEGLRNAYVSKNRAKIEDYTTPQLARAILQWMSGFDRVELNFNPVWMEIEADKVSVNISWRGSWISSGKVTEDRGMAIFELKGQPLKVDKILRANPFEAR